MSILYESVYPAKKRKKLQKTVRYDIPFPSNLGCGSLTQKMTLPMPPCTKESCLNAVNLVIVGNLVTSGAILVGVSAEVDFYVNGTLVASQSISYCSIPGCQAPINVATNIMAHVKDGDNDFAIDVRQSWSPLGCVTGVNSLKAYIEEIYTGTPPPPPTPTAPPWTTYLKYGLIGAGVLGAAYVGIRLYEARRKT